MSQGRIASLLENSGFLAVSGAVVLYGVLQGTKLWTLQLSLMFFAIDIVLLDAIASAFIFSGLFLFSGALFWRQIVNHHSSQDLHHDGGQITAIIPVYRDGNVLHCSVESLLQSNYSDVNICIVCEKDDADSIAQAEQLAENDAVSCLINTRYPGSKAGAINYAIEETDSPFVAVFDADEIVDENFLSHAVAKLASADAVQGRRIPEPTGVIESLTYYEKIFFQIGTQLRDLIGFHYALSASTVMKRHVFDTVSGYREEMVGEDLVFAHDCYRNNVSVATARRYPSYMEAPHTFKDLWGQKKRFLLAQVQLLHHALRHPVTYFTNMRSVVSAVVCGSGIVGNFLILALLAKFLLIFLLGFNTVFILPFSTLALLALSIRTYDVVYEDVESIGWLWSMFFLILPLFALVTLKSLFEYLFTWNGEWYHVQKGA